MIPNLYHRLKKNTKKQKLSEADVKAAVIHAYPNLVAKESCTMLVAPHGTLHFKIKTYKTLNR